MEEYNIQTAEDIQDALKEPLDGTSGNRLDCRQVSPVRRN